MLAPAAVGWNWLMALCQLVTPPPLIEESELSTAVE
jgi:hypothetical protein